MDHCNGASVDGGFGLVPSSMSSLKCEHSRASGATRLPPRAVEVNLAVSSEKVHPVRRAASRILDIETDIRGRIQGRAQLMCAGTYCHCVCGSKCLVYRLQVEASMPFQPKLKRAPGERAVESSHGRGEATGDVGRNINVVGNIRPGGS